MRTGVMLILICDILALVSYIINAVLAARVRDDKQAIIENALKYIMDNKVSFPFDLDLEKLVYNSLDLMIGISSLMAGIVFFPRVVVYIYMRNEKDGYSRRKITSYVRVVTLVLQILMLLSAIIGLIILLKQSYLIISFINIPGIVAYSLVLVWVLAFDIYFSCVYHKYYKKGFNKTKKAQKTPIQDISQTASDLNTSSTVDINKPYIPDQHFGNENKSRRKSEMIHNKTSPSKRSSVYSNEQQRPSMTYNQNIDIAYQDEVTSPSKKKKKKGRRSQIY
ncbi:UNKNOWN [Stylonychia lemnae]|uniref:Uncharacterized protein n=1 Tax=Stylonychia lemnae TaxID=5949 RepID=A0A078B258_STYLE|nr:UNKNOWN [Stylonychia lemnae]|eukprot:CDW87347.1 UNKNOWN [Stylonychia lemnae]